MLNVRCGCGRNRLKRPLVLLLRVISRHHHLQTINASRLLSLAIRKIGECSLRILEKVCNRTSSHNKLVQQMQMACWYYAHIIREIPNHLLWSFILCTINLSMQCKWKSQHLCFVWRSEEAPWNDNTLQNSKDWSRQDVSMFSILITKGVVSSECMLNFFGMKPWMESFVAFTQHCAPRPLHSLLFARWRFNHLIKVDECSPTPMKSNGPSIQLMLAGGVLLARTGKLYQKICLSSYLYFCKMKEKRG